MDEHAFEAEVWLHGEDPPWHFLTVPEDVSDAIAERTDGQRRGFGSVRVRVAIGGTTWSTSVFPDRRRGAYILPVKADVRRREGLGAGSRVAVTLEVLDPPADT
jgi:hypothetical protein